MKNARKISITLLAAMLAAIASSCGNSQNSPNTDTPDSSDTTPTETTDAIDARNAVSDDLPERNFNGETFTILTNEKRGKEFIADETGDVIDDAIYGRNLAVEERFGCKIEVNSELSESESFQFARRSVLANDDDFDLAALHVVYLGGALMDDLFLNWYDLDYINFDKPWWSKSTTEDLTYGKDKAVIAIGDLSLSTLSGTYCYFFDKVEAQNYQLENLYDVVNDGKWTFDYIMNVTKDMYRDLNGNGQRDDFDFYGVTHSMGSSINAYLWSCGNKIIDKNGKGEFEIVYKNERTNSIIDKIYQLLYESEGICTVRSALYPEDQVNHFFWIGALAFRDNLSTFIPGTLDMAINYFRTKQNEYGILPYPKLSESQDDYYTMVDGYHAALAVPKTARDLDFVAIITEALNAESYKTVFPAYYEVALKTKYTFDDESVEVLDRIVENRVFDFGYVYDNWKGMSFYFQFIMEAKSKDFESYYAKNSASAIDYYNKIFDFYENME